MKIFYNKTELASHLLSNTLTISSLGFVPTMGALHKGHLSLIAKALQENTMVIVSIFVNPTQFDNSKDLDKYPRALDNDVRLLKTVSANKIFVYAPTVDDIYEGNTVAQSFDFGGLENEMEGAFRHGHFDGVGTVVKRLLEIVKPHKAYFGEKDYQQLLIIKRLVTNFNIPVNIIGCPISRADDGLALSSRNARLKPEFRAAAPFIHKTLTIAKKRFGTKSAKDVTEWVVNQFKKEPLLQLEYFTIADASNLKPVKRKSSKKTYRAFIAVFADDIRLIDNISLN